jgi:hypothetical protein
VSFSLGASLSEPLELLNIILTLLGLTPRPNSVRVLLAISKLLLTKYKSGSKHTILPLGASLIPVVKFPGESISVHVLVNSE